MGKRFRCYGGLSGACDFPKAPVVFTSMSTEAETILKQFETLTLAEQRELWRELARRIAEKPSAVELYGEPLTDDDIAESARVTFQMLDEDEKRAQTR